jgi:hypothetical protein
MTNTERDFLNPPIKIDINAAQPARMTDYLLGGQANFAVDRDVTEYIVDALPGGAEAARATTRASQAFQSRVARYLVGEAGMRQLLYVGARLPSGVKVHELAQKIAPECRVVYVIDDDVTMAHAHTLVSSSPEGASAYIRARLHDPEHILEYAADTLDFGRPVGVMIQGALHQIPDDDEAHRVVARLMDAVPAGSYLSVSHLTAELLGNELAAAIERLQEMIEASKIAALTLRDHAQISQLLDGLELVEPGVVPIDKWHSDGTAEDASEEPDSLIYGAVARKPLPPAP